MQPINKKIILKSVVLGFMMTIALSFQYIIPDFKDIGFFGRNIDALYQVLHGYGILWSIVGVLLTGFVYVTLIHIRKQNENCNYFLVLISILFGILNVFGLLMYHLDDLPFFENGFWLFTTIYLICNWAILFYLVAHWVVFGIGKVYSYPNITGNLTSKSNWFMSLFCKSPFWFSFFAIIICWIPWLIAYYPASMDWDVYRQLCSALSLGEYARSNHDPWLASSVLAVFYKIGCYLGSQNIGIFLFVFFRDILIVTIYAGCIQLLYHSGVKRGICVLSLLFYSITPVWGAYAKHAFKDTLAAALFCAYICSLSVIIIQTRKKKLKWKHCLIFSVSAASASLFRNNPIYAIAPTTILLIIYLLHQKVSWKKCCLVFSCILVYFSFNYYIFNYAGVSKGSSREALSLAFQQTARTVKYHGDEITEEERAAIDAYLDYDSMGDVYDPLISDPVKDRCKELQNGENAPKNYLLTWFSMFFKYPDTYIESAVAGSYGYYAFTSQLPEYAGNWNSGMTIFDWIRVEPFMERFGFDFDYIDSMKEVRGILHSWAKVWDSLPIVSMTDTIAVYTWFIVLIGYTLLKRKRWPEMIPVLAMGIMILTCIASPVNASFRYYSPIAASVPALLLLIDKKHDSLSEIKEQDDNIEKANIS